MSSGKGGSGVAAVAVGLAAALGAAYVVSQTDSPAGKALREAASPLREAVGRAVESAGKELAHAGEALSGLVGHGHTHNGGGGHGHAHDGGGHGHAHGGGGDPFGDVASPARRAALLERLDDPRRLRWMAPERLVREVLIPLVEEARARAGATGGPATLPVPTRLGVDKAVVVADVGAGVGFFAARIASALAESPSTIPAIVVATEPAAWLRETLLVRAVEAGLKNVVIVPGGASRAGVADAPWGDAISTGLAAGPGGGPLGVRADVLLLANVYHHITGLPRADWLKATVASDVAKDGYIVFLEYKPSPPAPATQPLPVGGSSSEGGASAGGSSSSSSSSSSGGGMPPAAGAEVDDDALPEGGIEGPPGWMRLDRSTILAEAAEAGLELVSAPPFLRHMHVLVFRKRAGAA